jgi:hypothetical protein
MELMSNIINSKPSSYQEEENKQLWWDAMMKEYKSFTKDDVWDIVPRLEGNPMVISKWIYKNKHVVDGSIENFKARFVARGFSQKEGVDYEETFNPLDMYTSIK